MKLSNSKYVKILKSVFIIAPSLLFLAACDFTMIKDLVIFPDFTRKLSVTAYIDSEIGCFDIRIMESIGIAATPRVEEIEIIRNGEIRLYKDGEIMRTISGPFDMSRKILAFGDQWKWGQNGCQKFLSGIDIFPGSFYRLEVEIEGFPMAVATSVMPEAPVVSASIDTSVQMVKKNIKEVYSAGFYLYNFRGFEYDNYPERYWPLSVRVNVRDRNFYTTLDIFMTEYHFVNNTFLGGSTRNWGIGASDASIFLADGMNQGLMNNENVDLYLFSLLTAKDIFFSDALRTFYTAVDESIHKTNDDNSHYEDNPDFEKVVVNHSLILRVRNITPATYNYYNSLRLQLESSNILSEPAIVVGNIEGGYGSFAVYNTVSIPLLEWETYFYRKKEE